MKPLLIRHIEGEPVGRFPVWMMRQAGRFLPSYQAVRKQHSFWEMVTTPELASEVSLLPLEELKTDAVIFFSDILTLPYGLGLPIQMQENVGPVVTTPLSPLVDFEIFKDFSADKHTPFVGEALKMCRNKMPEDVALLGFAGAPWTVASYLIEGRSSRSFEKMKYWEYEKPKVLTSALQNFAVATVNYLKWQIKNGAQAVQLFDTWLSEMSAEYFRNYYIPVLNSIFEEIKKEKIPMIYFAKHAHHLLPDFNQLKMDGLSCDSLIPISEVSIATKGRFFLQGNLDPVFLLTAEESSVRLRTRLLVQEARTLSRPVVLNLGHGILPKTPVQNVRAFVEESKALWL